MKKLVLFFAAALAISFASCCGNQSAQTEEVVVIEEAVEVAPIEDVEVEEAAPEVELEVAD